MKQGFYLLAIIGVVSLLPAQAQNCKGLEDCLAKANELPNNQSGNEKAIEYLTKAIKYAKKDPEAQAKAYHKRGRRTYRIANNEKLTKAAQQDFEKTLQITPDYYWPKYYLIYLAMYKQKDLPRAKMLLDQFLSAEPQNAHLYYLQGRYELRKGNLDKELSSYVRFQELMLSGENTNDQVGDVDLAWAEEAYIDAYMKKQGLKVYDQKALSILKEGNQIADRHSLISGKLAMAYFDQEQYYSALDEAEIAYGRNKKNADALFVLGYDDWFNFDHKSARKKIDLAFEYGENPHPAWYFYGNAARYKYYYNTASDEWKYQHEAMTQGFEKFISMASGTRYEKLIPEAQDYLAKIEEYSQAEARRVGKLIANDFEEFKINFSQMPNGYVLDYNTLQGRNVSNLKMTRRYFPMGGSSYAAIGLVAKGKEKYTFLLMSRDVRSAYLEQIDFILLTTDKYGVEVERNSVAYTQKDNGSVSVKGIFKLSTDGTSYFFDCKNTTVATNQVESWQVQGNCDE
ncbi:tetratricopeptide repeat protein [Reichenbachiella sp.]|uniref:tetratricopeptide repeat protein n=1 Tax=Reichenbachiella sp. TaxID=2184521 RepID=UPI003B599025